VLPLCWLQQMVGLLEQQVCQLGLGWQLQQAQLLQVPAAAACPAAAAVSWDPLELQGHAVVVLLLCWPAARHPGSAAVAAVVQGLYCLRLDLWGHAAAAAAVCLLQVACWQLL
jgi:hypothetical protein